MTAPPSRPTACARCTAGPSGSRRSTCASSPARCSASSGPTAPARRRPSSCCSGSRGRPPATARCSAGRSATARRGGGVGYLPELFRYQAWLTAHEVLTLHAQLGGPAGQGPARPRSSASSALVGLADRADDRIGGFSKGMQQRLGLAAALLGDPALVILDEPTSALDPVGRDDVRAIIREARDAARPCSSTRTCWARSSGCATGSRSSTTAGSSPRARSATCWASRRSGCGSPGCRRPGGHGGPRRVRRVAHDDDWLDDPPDRPRPRSPTPSPRSSGSAAASTPSIPAGAASRTCSSGMVREDGGAVGSAAGGRAA